MLRLPAFLHLLYLLVLSQFFFVSNSAANTGVVFEGQTVLFSDDFESYTNGYDLYAPTGQWSRGSWGYGYVSADATDPENSVLVHTLNSGSGPRSWVGDESWGDQALSFKFRWNGSLSQYYLWSAAVRRTSGMYYLYATDETNDGRVRLHLRRSGHNNILNQQFGVGNWTGWRAEYLRDNYLFGEPAGDVISSLDIPVVANQWHEVTIRAKGHYLQVYFDGEPIERLIIDRFDVNPNGRIGLTGASIVELDDVVVSDWQDSGAILQFSHSAGNANNIALVAGQPLTMNWEALDAIDVRLLANGQNILTDDVNSFTVFPTEDTHYKLIAEGTAGSESRILFVDVSPAAEFTELNSSANRLVAGESLTVTWNTVGADSVRIVGVADNLPASGSYTLSPTESQSYTFEAIGAANTDSQTLNIEVGQVVNVDYAPYVLPSINDLLTNGSVQFDAQYLLDIGGYASVQSPITWSVEPAGIVTISENGLVSAIPGAEPQTVAIRATVNGTTYVRYLYADTDSETNLVGNSSFELNDSSYSAQVWSGPCQVTRTSHTAYDGDHSLQLGCSGDGRVGLFYSVALEPGKYRFSALLRGLNIAESGLWGRNTELLIIDQAGGQIVATQPLLSGTFGWTPFEYTFEVTEATSYYIYFRQFSRGNLWIDDVELRSVESAESLQFRLGNEVAITPSLCELDAPSCVAGPLLPDHLLTDFNSQSTSIFSVANNATLSTEDGDGDGSADLSVSIPAGESGWVSAYNYTGLATDWSDYDYVEFSVFSGMDDLTRFYIEIRDAQTTNYWTRVNWYDQLTPGINRFRIPLQIFVGERIQVNPQRKLLIDQITRLAFSFADGGYYWISDIRLTQEPNQCSRPASVKAFDFGTDQSPLQTNFDPIYGHTTYAACRGYGLTEAADTWRIEDRRSPDNLWRDWISFYDDNIDDFRVDLPDGNYRVHLYWEDPGYWELYANYTNRHVTAEGVRYCEQGSIFDDFINRYFAHEYQEDKPDTDGWNRYIRDRYQSNCQFTVSVTDGALELAFGGSNPYAATVNGLVIYPESDAVAAEQWLNAVDTMRKTAYEFDYRKVDIASVSGDTNGSDATSNTAGDYQLFARPLDKDIYLNTKPAADELLSALTHQALQGERLLTSFAVRPLVDLGSVDGIQVSGLPAGFSIDARQVFHMDRRIVADGNIYASKPHLLDSALNADLIANESRQFTLAIIVPQNIAAGSYSGSVDITLSNGSVIGIPLTLDITAEALPRSPIRHSVLGVFPTYTGGVFNEQFEAKAWNEVPQILSLLSNYGMTAITGMYPSEYTDGHCDNTRAQQFIDMIAAHNFAPLIHSYGAKGGAGHTTLRDFYRANNSARALGIVDCTNVLYEQNGYEIAWSLFDEPGSESAISEILAMYNWYETNSTSGFSNSGFTSLYASGSEGLQQARSNLFNETDYPFLTLLEDEQALLERRNAGQAWGMYNLPTRYGYGVFAWMLAQQYGLTDVSTFAIHSMQSDHYYVLDSREADVGFIFTDRNGNIRPTLSLERISAGITDFRYLVALQNKIAQQPTTAAAQNAQGYLDNLLQRFPLSRRGDKVSYQELDIIREELRVLLKAF